MNISRQILLMALAGITHGAHSAHAAEAESAVPAPSIFIEQAAQSGLAEIEAAKAALGRSQDPSVRSFAQRMVQDHGKANAELMSLARTKGIDVPTTLDDAHRAMVNEITARTGADFDRSYAQHMAMGHAKAVALFEAAANSPDAAMSDFARKTLPTLREHRKLADKLPGKTVKGDIPAG